MKDFLIFVNIITKTYYNKSHKFLKLLKKSEVYLRFHYNYKIFNIKNRKLYHQRAGFFKVFNKIDMFIYRFELSLMMNIHFIIFII